MNIQNLAAIFVATSLTGCAGVAMTPLEFRDSVKQEGEYIDSLIVNRPFGEVTRTMKKMSDECLNFSLASSTNGQIGKPWAWVKGSLEVSAKHAELRLQYKTTNYIGTRPEDGVYLLVSDVTPVGAARTQVDIYYWENVKDAAKAIKGWASGDMLGCPDPGRMFHA